MKNSIDPFNLEVGKKYILQWEKDILNNSPHKLVFDRYVEVTGRRCCGSFSRYIFVAADGEVIYVGEEAFHLKKLKIKEHKEIN